MKGFRENKKLANSSMMKIRTRFFNKVEEFKLKSSEELDKMYEETKMSSTDRNALLVAMSELKKNEKVTKSEDKNVEEIEKE